jgi:hypothetical protein
LTGTGFKNCDEGQDRVTNLTGWWDRFTPGQDMDIRVLARAFYIAYWAGMKL